MQQYPEKTCEIDRLVRNKKLRKSMLEGVKTQQRRDGIYAYPDEEFEIDGVKFVVTSVERKTLADMTEADARAEGFEGLDSYRDLILKMHSGMEWNESHKVWVHTFRKA